MSEWLIYLGLFDAGIAHGPAGWAAIPIAIVLGTAGAVTLASFVKAGALVFTGAPRTKRVAQAHEAGTWMLGMMLLLAGICVVVGLAPGLCWPLVARAAGAWNPAWAAAVPAPASLTTLGLVHCGLAGVAIAAATVLWRRARANGWRRGPTWDCGYAAPTARMQYTGGSFSGITTGWFFWLLWPERALQRPRGPMPLGARLVERVPETVLERVISPVGQGVLRVSTAVRRLQHGRLQYYIVYLVAGLAALAALVLVGGAR